MASTFIGMKIKPKVENKKPTEKKPKVENKK